MAEDPIGLAGSDINVNAYADADPVSATDPLGLFDLVRPMRPPSFFDLTTFQALRRDTTLDEAVSRGTGFRNITAPAIAISLSPYAAGLAGSAGATACRLAPEVLPRAIEACKNPVLAAALGASICGNMAGTVKGTAREFVRTRERLQEIREASERIYRANGARQISR